MAITVRGERTVSKGERIGSSTAITRLRNQSSTSSNQSSSRPEDVPGAIASTVYQGGAGVIVQSSQQNPRTVQEAVVSTPGLVASSNKPGEYITSSGQRVTAVASTQSQSGAPGIIATQQVSNDKSSSVVINPNTGRPYGSITEAKVNSPAVQAGRDFVRSAYLATGFGTPTFNERNIPETPAGTAGRGLTVVGSAYFLGAKGLAIAGRVPVASQVLGLRSGVASGALNVAVGVSGFKAYTEARKFSNVPLGTGVFYGSNLDYDTARSVTNVGSSQGFVRGLIPQFSSKEVFIRQASQELLDRGVVKSLSEGRGVASGLYAQEYGTSNFGILGPSTAQTSSIILGNRATEIGGRQAFANVFGKLQSRGYVMPLNQAARRSFNLGAAVISPQGAAEAIGDVAIYRISREESISGRDIVLAGSAGGAIGGLIGGGAVALPYIKSSALKTSVRASVATVNVLDLGEKPGDFAADLAEQYTIRRGGRVSVPVTTKTNEGVIPSVVVNSRSGASVSTLFSSPTRSDSLFENIGVNFPTRSQNPVSSRSIISSSVNTLVSTRSTVVSDVFTPVTVPVNVKTPVSNRVTVPVNVVSGPGVPLLPLPKNLGQGGGSGGSRKQGTSRKGVFAPDFTAAFFGQRAGKGTVRVRDSGLLNPLSRRFI